MANTPLELTYCEAAQILGVSPRHCRRIVGQYPHIIRPLRYGHKTVRLPLSQLVRVRKAWRADALKGGRP